MISQSYLFLLIFVIYRVLHIDPNTSAFLCCRSWLAWNCYIIHTLLFVILNIFAIVFIIYKSMLPRFFIHLLFIINIWDICFLVIYANLFYFVLLWLSLFKIIITHFLLLFVIIITFSKFYYYSFITIRPSVFVSGVSLFNIIRISLSYLLLLIFVMYCAIHFDLSTSTFLCFRSWLA